MEISEYINQQTAERQSVLSALHQIIVDNDPNVVAHIGDMMSKRMILYNQYNTFKYGLASVKEHISLHAMPIYMDASLHKKYSELLPKAKFQKGCINFKTAEEFPLDIAADFIADCAKVDIAAVLAARSTKKKK